MGDFVVSGLWFCESERCFAGIAYIGTAGMLGISELASVLGLRGNRQLRVYEGSD